MGSRKKSDIRIKKKVNVRLKNCLKKKPAKKLNNFKTADVEVLLINCCLKKKKSSPAKKTKEVGIVLKKVCLEKFFRRENCIYILQPKIKLAVLRLSSSMEFDKAESNPPTFANKDDLKNTQIGNIRKTPTGKENIQEESSSVSPSKQKKYHEFPKSPKKLSSHDGKISSHDGKSSSHDGKSYSEDSSHDGKSSSHDGKSYSEDDNPTKNNQSLEVNTGDKTSESNVSKPASDKTPDLNKPKDLITSSDLGKSRIEELRSPTTSHSPVVKTQREKDLKGVPDISEAEDKKDEDGLSDSVATNKDISAILYFKPADKIKDDGDITGGNDQTKNDALTNGTVVNGTTTNGTIVNGTSTNGTLVNGTTTNQNVINETTTNGTVVNGKTTNWTAVNGSTTNGTVVNGTTTNGAVPNITVVNGTVAIGTVDNGTDVNRTVANENVINGTISNGTGSNGTLVPVMSGEADDLTNTVTIVNANISTHEITDNSTNESSCEVTKGKENTDLSTNEISSIVTNKREKNLTNEKSCTLTNQKLKTATNENAASSTNEKCRTNVNVASSTNENVASSSNEKCRTNENAASSTSETDGDIASEMFPEESLASSESLAPCKSASKSNDEDGKRNSCDISIGELEAVTPKRGRGRPKKGSVPVSRDKVVQKQSVIKPAEDTVLAPRKRGVPKKFLEAFEPAHKKMNKSTVVAPKKRGRPKKVVDTVEPDLKTPKLNKLNSSNESIDSQPDAKKQKADLSDENILDESGAKTTEPLKKVRKISTSKTLKEESKSSKKNELKSAENNLKSTKNDSKSTKKEEQSWSEDDEEWVLNKTEKTTIAEMTEFLRNTNLNFIPAPFTKGDGNCFYRAVVEQVIMHNIKDKPLNHKAMRREVTTHIKKLPAEVQQTMIDVVFNGKPRALPDFAYYHRKPDKWVDDKGILVLATAYYLNRTIHIYSYPQDDSREFGLTVQEGGEGSKDLKPINIFFDNQHYQSLKPTKPTESAT